MNIAAFLALIALIAPASASALTPTEVPALFINTFVGIYLTIILLTLGTGLFLYFGRLGTWPSNRDEAIIVFEWTVVMLFTLVVIVAVAQFIERDPQFAMRILGFVAACAFIALLAWAVKTSGSAEEKKPEKK